MVISHLRSSYLVEFMNFVLIWVDIKRLKFRRYPTFFNCFYYFYFCLQRLQATILESRNHSIFMSYSAKTLIQKATPHRSTEKVKNSALSAHELIYSDLSLLVKIEKKLKPDVIYQCVCISWCRDVGDNEKQWDRTHCRRF